MRNTIKTFFVLSVLFLSIAYAQAQKNKPFEGVITFSMNFDDEGLDPASKSMLANSEMIVYIKDEKSRMDIDMGMMKNSNIIDSKNKTASVLMDIMGQKMVMKVNAEEMDKKGEKEPKITYLDETKQIAGYKCKKAQVDDGENEPVTVYYTEEIPVSKYNSQIRGIKGYPLEYESNQSGLKVMFTAKAVKKEQVAESKFIVPADYKEITKEELQKMLGGGM